MAPPTFGDMGKSARDVFGKGYHIGVMKLDVKTKSTSGMEFNAGCNSNTDSGNVTGELETKYKCMEHGVTFTEKWNTDNKLVTTVDVQDKVMKGLKLTLDTSFSPQTGAKKGVVKAEYKHDMVSFNSDFDLNLAGPMVNASAVIGQKGWLAGYQMAFDCSKSKLAKNNFCIGYAAPEFTLHANVDDGQIFGASVYQKPRPDLETAVNLGWTASKNEAKFGVGCKYMLDKDASIRAKVSNSSLVGLGYQQKLRDGVTLTLSALLDGKNFDQGGHKLGFSLEFEA